MSNQPVRRVLEPVSDTGRNGLDYRELLKVSLDSLLANRLRTFLTMLGIIIGVASVVSLMTLGNGASEAITGQFSALGTNVLTIFNGRPNRGPGQSGNIAPLTMSDYKAIERIKLPIVGPVPQFSSNATIAAPAADKSSTVIGTTADYAKVQSVIMASGTFFTDANVQGASQVVVLGSSLKTYLFGSGEAVGETVRINSLACRVIGVMAAKGGGPFGSPDDQALVPITLAHTRLFAARTSDGNLRINLISLSVIKADDIDFTQQRIQMTLRDLRKLKSDGSEDDFNVINQASFLSSLSTITTLLTTFLAAIAGISLLVGGIGIMNIMLVSVTERTKEIGLRRAVGAQSRDILLQFMIEAVVLSFLGGFIGVVFGSILPIVLTVSGTFNAPVTLNSVVISLSVSLATGLFFGIWPARNAANLNPIQALRHE
ncbi:MAG: ABC transporter permease [Chloroflexales bacterium]|nr:ABC transporter permease [Chloroflexales bacterium]